MLQSQRNKATVSVLNRLRNKGMPKPSMLPEEMSSEEDGSMEPAAELGEMDAVDSAENALDGMDMPELVPTPSKKKYRITR